MLPSEEAEHAIDEIREHFTDKGYDTKRAVGNACVTVDDVQIEIVRGRGFWTLRVTDLNTFDQEIENPEGGEEARDRAIALFNQFR